MKFSEINIGDIYQSNNYGSFEVIKKEPAKSPKITVRFVNTGYTTIIKPFDCSTGSVMDKLVPKRFGVGFIGDGEYNYYDEGGQASLCGVKWKSMLERCYCPKYQKKHLSYVGCSVETNWHNFQTFAEWFYRTYPKDGCYYELDKDYKIKGNKVYSEVTCMWLSKTKNISISKEKTYRFYDPNGVLFEITNLKQFCLGKDLIRELMGKVYNGKRKHHKGWTKAD